MPMLTENGSIYEDENCLYHVVASHVKWQTNEWFVEFVSFNTGENYILEQSEFLKTRKLFLEAE